jgi:hypothetical protein
MSQLSLQTINLGDYANDGTGDDLRTAFAKVNINFDNIETNFPSSLSEDTEPRLGGDLDLNGYNLSSYGTISIQPGGDGVVVVGNVTADRFIGQISDISDHKLDELSDVVIPEDVVAGQSLVWNGTEWTPGMVDASVTGVDGGGAATIFNLDEGVVIDGGFAE